MIVVTSDGLRTARVSWIGFAGDFTVTIGPPNAFLLGYFRNDEGIRWIRGHDLASREACALQVTIALS